MEIRELSAQTNVPPKTIRYYEEIGLLPSPARKPNGYRQYFKPDVQRLKLVAGARRLDISLIEIQEILDMRDRQEAPCDRLLELIAQKRAEIQLRIEQMKQMDSELMNLYELGKTFPRDDIEGKNCVCHLVSERAE
ncbi:MAG: MerR family transcriptional regulator [Anaerolineales bacterium]